MDEFMKTTKDAGHTAELERLNAQHEVITDAMGALFLAPLDLSKPGLKILDSATADGRWLHDLNKSSPSQHTYIGTDIEPELFPNNLPSNITLHKQSFTNPWPTSYTSTFDLVHQRLGLAGAGQFPISTVIKNFADLCKSGGYVELVELNTTPASDSGPAFGDLAKLMREIFDRIGVGADYAVKMQDFLEGAGLVDVQEQRVVCKVGKLGKSELRQKGVDAMCAAVAPLAAVAKTIPTSFSEEELGRLEARLREEMESHGEVYEIVVAYGRKP